MNGSGGSLEKARIEALEGSRRGQPVECMFNPKEFTIQKQNNWQRGKVQGKEVPQLEFSGGNASTLQMELFFDTYEDDKDVRDLTNKIWGLMAVDESLKDRTTTRGRPPLCQFMWGPMKSFKAVITSISQKFTMFKSDGTPVRATLSVSFQEAEKADSYPLQNPTSGGSPGYKTRRVKEGDALDWIAHEEYGDASLWRFIADTNNIDNPKILEPGQILSIAPLP
jgi:LysM repeat protein